MIAASLTIGIGGSGGVFAPSLFIGATSGMAFGEIAGHIIGPAAGQPALYAVIAMGAVFASAARAPLTSLASVVELTGDCTLTLPVMLAVAVATLTSRAVSYGTIYTTKLLRRGIDIDHPPAGDPFEELTAADAMRRFPRPLAIEPAPDRPGTLLEPGRGSLPGPVTGHRRPQSLFAGESMTQALRQLALYGRDGLPVLAADGQQLEGWLTTQSMLHAVHRAVSSSRAAADRAGRALPGPQEALRQAPDPLPGYQLLEITITSGSAAAGRALGDITWPPGSAPVSVATDHTLRDPDPVITLNPGDRVNLLVPVPHQSLSFSASSGEPASPAGDSPAGRPSPGRASPPRQSDQQ